VAADLTGHTLGLLGAGNMAEALARGALKARVLTPQSIIASDVAPARLEFFARELGVCTVPENRAVVQAADLLLLCTKPQQTDDVLKDIAPIFDVKRHVLASIAAGVPTARLEKHLPQGARVVRVMPNTPLLVGLGASCLCRGAHATGADEEMIAALFASSGTTLKVEERMLDAVTGLSGSGPAYLFYLVEAMVDAGVAEGFPREVALRLAAQTCLGASKMLMETGEQPEELRRRVTSPNGTTQAAVEKMDAAGVKASITQAVRRAAERSRELGQGAK